MKILITGGHMTPALAVIQKLPKDIAVVYVGRKFAFEGDSALSLEYRTLTAMDIPFIPLQSGRLQRKFTKHTFPSLGRIPKGVWEAFSILRREKPSIVLSFGGHVAFPICLAASVLKIPIVMHEQTQEAGGANHLLSRMATKICVSWESSLKFFPKEKTILTGNPLPITTPSKEIKEVLQKNSKKYPILTITGGSLGSHAINALIEPILEKLLSHYVVVHQTGDAQEFKDFDRLTEFRASLPYTFQERYILKKFIDPEDIAFVYKTSDVVVTRSGMNTVLTLLFVNTPSLLIPLPFSQRQEQMKNALLLKASGLGEILLQDQLTSESLLTAIDTMMEKRAFYKNPQSKNMQKLHEGAAGKIIQVIYDTEKNYLQKKT